MNVEQGDNYIYSEEVLNFVRNCKKFTDMLEREDADRRKESILELLGILPALYSSMIRLRPESPVYTMPAEKFVTEEKWASVYRYVAGIMGSQNEYLDLPGDDEYDRLDIISRELSEDLADIYQDVKDFTEVFRYGSEEIMSEALWECRSAFENYWGEKSLRASLNLHKILMRDEETLEKMDREFEEKPGGREIRTDEWFISKRQNEAGED